MFVDSLFNQIVLNFTNLHNVCNTNFKGALTYNGYSYGNLDGGMNTHDTIAKTTSFNSFTAITYGNKTLYGGTFQSLGSNKLFSQSVGLWNGTKWDTFPKKMFNPKTIGSQPYVGGFYKTENKLWIYGSFDSIAGIACKNICTFDGTNFTPINIPVQTNIGIGQVIKYKGEIYIIGAFFNNPSTTIEKIIRYNPTTNVWSSVGNGLKGSFSTIRNMTIYNDTLYLAGSFNKADGHVGNYIMKWDGTQLYDAGFGNFYGWWYINQLLTFNNKLYAFGNFIYANDKTAYNCAYYENGKWTPNTDSLNSPITNAVIFNNSIYISGAFNQIKGDTSIKCFAKLRCPNFDNCISQPETSTEVFLPQGISINGDGINDELIIKLPNTKSATLQVFNRWGSQVFKTTETNPNIDTPLTLKWNGTYKNQQLPYGTYFYLIESTDNNNKQKIYKQFVQIVY